MSKNKNKALYLALKSNSKTKSEAIDFRPKSYSNIYIIICKPLSEKFYSISINDVNNAEIIDRFSVVEYIGNIAPNVSNVNNYVSKYLSFAIFIEENEIKELEKIEDTLDKYSFYKEALKEESATTPLFNSVIDKFSKLQYSILKTKK